MSSHDQKVKGPKKKVADGPSIKRLKQLHKEKVNCKVICKDVKIRYGIYLKYKLLYCVIFIYMSCYIPRLCMY